MTTSRCAPSLYKSASGWLLTGRGRFNSATFSQSASWHAVRLWSHRYSSSGARIQRARAKRAAERASAAAARGGKRGGGRGGGRDLPPTDDLEVGTRPTADQCFANCNVSVTYYSSPTRCMPSGPTRGVQMGRLGASLGALKVTYAPIHRFRGHFKSCVCEAPISYRTRIFGNDISRRSPLVIRAGTR